jgi:hypothetical protein
LTPPHIAFSVAQEALQFKTVVFRRRCRRNWGFTAFTRRTTSSVRGRIVNDGSNAKVRPATVALMLTAAVN